MVMAYLGLYGEVGGNDVDGVPYHSCPRAEAKEKMQLQLQATSSQNCCGPRMMTMMMLMVLVVMVLTMGTMTMPTTPVEG